MLKNIFRNIAWRLLGISYPHILKSIDYVFLDKDRFTVIGNKSYHNGAIVYRWTDLPLVIGKYSCISYGVKFIMDDGGHQHYRITSYPFNSTTSELPQGIEIGNDVWIGLNSVILPGVKIGDGATVAAALHLM